MSDTAGTWVILLESLYSRNYTAFAPGFSETSQMIPGGQQMSVIGMPIVYLHHTAGVRPVRVQLCHFSCKTVPVLLQNVVVVTVANVLGTPVGRRTVAYTNGASAKPWGDPRGLLRSNSASRKLMFRSIQTL